MITVHNNNRTLAEVRNVALARPADAGKFWKGIRHGVLVDVLLHEFDVRGWRVEDMRFAVSKNGTDLAAAFGLIVPETDAPEGIRFALGLMHNNNRERALKVYAGGTVEVCGNGLATGRVLVHRKHTRGLRLAERMSMAVDDFLLAAVNMDRVVDDLKRYRLRGGQYDHALVEAGRRGLMPWSRLGVVDEECRRPRWPDEIGTGTSWALLNAFTLVAKRNPPHRQMDQIDRFRELLPPFC